ncbi:MAG: alpha/beta fold hydrolase [Myxococcota bacterium]
MTAVPAWLDRSRWPHDVHSYTDPDGTMAFVDVGPPDAAPVVFVHGTPTWSIEWAAQLEGLPQRRCIAVDHLGFGLSSRPDVGYRPEDHAARFSRFIQHLGLSDVTLVVHDFGGPIALPWAIANPDRVRHLVIVNTWGWSLDDVAHVARPARVFGTGFGRWLYGTFNVSIELLAATAWTDRQRWRQLLDQIRPVFPDYRSRTQVLWALAKSLLGSSSHYASIEAGLSELSGVRRSVFWGTEDPAFPKTFRDRWLEHWPDAERIDVAAGHWPHVEMPAPLIEHLRQN